ncbi:carboxylesterase family protein [Streptomyces sp. NBC_01604]|uniref:carboxylesterase family protein n=1 Tax=Streptomyces TaxID=1883 RepID=UPI00386D5384
MGGPAAFGGDPRQVTLAGESARGSAVCALLASPDLRRLPQGSDVRLRRRHRRQGGRATRSVPTSARLRLCRGLR